MTKSALGRGLGDLLEDTRGGNQPEAPAPAPLQPQAAPAKLDPGLHALVRGGPAARPASARAKNPFAGTRTPARASLRLLRWSLVGGDVALCTLVGLFVSRRGLPLSGGELAACVIGLGLGAWLSCLAVVMEEDAQSNPEAPRAVEE